MASEFAIFSAVFDSELLRALSQVLHSVEGWAIDGYARAPVLMAALVLVMTVPPLALAGHIASGLSSYIRRHPALPEPMGTSRAAAAGLGWPRDAWIVVGDVAASADAGRRPVRREMLSFGREDDNDVRLEHATVHRHHAVLHRTPEAHFIIRDLSGPRGNGVKVNGQRVSQRSLEDGDRIEIGAVQIRFEAQFS